MIACPRCSTENPDDSRYCKWCGRSLELTPQVVRRQAAAPGLGLFAAVVLLLLLGCCVIMAAAVVTSRRTPAIFRRAAPPPVTAYADWPRALVEPGWGQD